MATQPGLGGLAQSRKQFEAALKSYSPQDRSILQGEVNAAFGGAKSESGLGAASQRMGSFLNRNARGFNTQIDQYMQSLAQMGLSPDQLAQVKATYLKQVDDFMKPLRLATKQGLEAAKGTAPIDPKFKLDTAEKVATDIALGARRTTLGALAGTAMDTVTGPMFLPQGYEENRYVSGTAQALGLAAEMAAPGAGLLGKAAPIIGAQGIAARLGGEAALRLAGRGAGQAAKSPGIAGLRELAKKALQGDAAAKAALKSRAITGGVAGAGAGTALGLSQTAVQELPGARPVMGDLGNERAAAPTAMDYLRSAGMGALGGGLGGAFAGAIGPTTSRAGAIGTELGSEAIGAAPDAITQYATTGKVDIAGLLPGVFAAGAVGGAVGPDVGPTRPVGAPITPPVPGAQRPARTWTGEELLAPKRMDRAQQGDTVTLPNAQGGTDTYEVLADPKGGSQMRVRDAKGNEFRLDLRGTTNPLTLNTLGAGRIAEQPSAVGRKPKPLADVLAGTEGPLAVGDVLAVPIGGARRPLVVDEIRPDGVALLRERDELYELDLNNIANPSDVAGQLFRVTSPGRSMVSSSNAIRSSVGRLVLAETTDPQTGDTRTNAVVINNFDSGQTKKDQQRGGLVTFTELDTGKKRTMSFSKFSEKFGEARTYNPYEDLVTDYRDAAVEGEIRSGDQEAALEDITSRVAQEVNEAEARGYGDAARSHVAMLAEELRAEQRPDMEELAGWMKLSALPPDLFARQYVEQEFTNASPELKQQAQATFIRGAIEVANKIMQLPSSPELAGISDSKEYKRKYAELRSRLVRTGASSPDTLQYIQAVNTSLKELQAQQKGASRPVTPTTQMAQAAEAEFATATPPVVEEVTAAPEAEPEPEAEAAYSPEELATMREDVNVAIAAAEDALNSDDTETFNSLLTQMQEGVDSGFVTPEEKQRFDRAIEYVRRGESVPESIYEEVTVPSAPPIVVEAAKPAEAPKPVEVPKAAEPTKPAEAPKPAETPKTVEAPKPAEAPKGVATPAAPKAETKPAEAPPAPKAETKPAPPPAETPAVGREVKTGGGRGNPPRTFIIDAELPDGSMVLRNKTPRGVSQPYTAPADSPPVLAIRAKEAKAAAEVKEPAPTPAPEVKAAAEPTPAVEAPAVAAAAPAIEPRTINIPAKAAELLTAGNLTATNRAARDGIEKMREAVARRDAEALETVKAETLANVEKLGKTDRIAAGEMKSLVESTYTTVKGALDKALTAPAAEAKTPAPRRAAKPAEAPKPAETPKAAEAPKAAETPKPVEVPEEVKRAGEAVVTAAPTPEAGPVRVKETLQRKVVNPVTKSVQTQHDIFLSDGSMTTVEYFKDGFYKPIKDVSQPRELVGKTLKDAKENLVKAANAPAPREAAAPAKPQTRVEKVPVYEDVPPAPIVYLPQGTARATIPGERRRTNFEETKEVMARQKRGEPVTEADLYVQLSPDREFDVEGYDESGALLVRPVGKNGKAAAKATPVPKDNAMYAPLRMQYERALVDEGIKQLPELPVERLPNVPRLADNIRALKEAAIVGPDGVDAALDRVKRAKERFPGEYAGVVDESARILTDILEQKPTRRQTGEREVEQIVPARPEGVDLEKTYSKYQGAKLTKDEEALLARLQSEVEDDPEFAKAVSETQAEIAAALQEGNTDTAARLERDLQRIRRNKDEELTQLVLQEREMRSAGYAATKITRKRNQPVGTPEEPKPVVEEYKPELLPEDIKESTYKLIEREFDPTFRSLVGDMARARDGRRPEEVRRLAQERLAFYGQETEAAARETLDVLVRAAIDEGTRSGTEASARKQAARQQLEDEIARLKQAVDAPEGQNEYELALVELDKKLEGTRNAKDYAKEAGKLLRVAQKEDTARRNQLKKDRKALEKEIAKLPADQQGPAQTRLYQMDEALKAPVPDLKEAIAQIRAQREQDIDLRDQLARTTREVLRQRLAVLQNSRADLIKQLDQIANFSGNLDEEARLLLRQQSKFLTLVDLTTMSDKAAADLLLGNVSKSLKLNLARGYAEDITAMQEGDQTVFAVNAKQAAYAAAEKLVSFLKQARARTQNRYRYVRGMVESLASSMVAEAQGKASLISVDTDKGLKHYSVSARDNNYWMVREVDEDGYPIADEQGNYPPPQKLSTKGKSAGAKLVRLLKEAEEGGDSDVDNRPEGRFVTDANGVSYVLAGTTPGMTVKLPNGREVVNTTDLIVYKKRNRRWQAEPVRVTEMVQSGTKRNPDTGEIAPTYTLNSAWQAIRVGDAATTLSELKLFRDEINLFEQAFNHTLMLPRRQVEAAKNKIAAMGPETIQRYNQYENAMDVLLDSGAVATPLPTPLEETGDPLGEELRGYELNVKREVMKLAEQRNIPVEEVSDVQRPLADVPLSNRENNDGLIERYLTADRVLNPDPIEIKEPDGTVRRYLVRQKGVASREDSQNVNDILEQSGLAGEERDALSRSLRDDATTLVAEVDENGVPVGNEFSLLDLRRSEDVELRTPEAQGRLTLQRQEYFKGLTKKASEKMSKYFDALDSLQKVYDAPAGENYYERKVKELDAKIAAVQDKLAATKNKTTKTAVKLRDELSALFTERDKFRNVTRGRIGDRIVQFQDAINVLYEQAKYGVRAAKTEAQEPLYDILAGGAREEASRLKEIMNNPATLRERERASRQQGMIRGEILLRGKDAVQEFIKRTNIPLAGLLLAGTATLSAAPAYAATNGFMGGAPAQALDMLGMAAANPGAALAGLSAAAIAGATVFAAKRAGGFSKFLRDFAQRPEIAEYLDSMRSRKERLAFYQDVQGMWNRTVALLQKVAYGASAVRGGINAVINTALRGAGEEIADYRQLSGKDRDEFMRFFNNGLRGTAKEVWRQGGRPRVTKAVQAINDYLLAGGHDSGAAQLNNLTGMDRLAINERLAGMLEEADTQRSVLKQIANKYSEDLNDRINTPADRERLHRFLLIEESDLTPAEQAEYADFLGDENIMQMRQELDEVADRVAALGGISAGARAAYRGRFLQNSGVGMRKGEAAELGRNLLNLLTLSEKRGAAEVGQKKSEYRGVAREGFKTSEARDVFLSERNKEWIIQDTFETDDGEYATLASIDGEVRDVRVDDLNNYNIEGRTQKWRRVDDLRNDTFKAVRDLTPEEIESQGITLDGPQAFVNTLRTLANQERRFQLANVIAHDPEYATSARTSEDLNKSWGLRQWGKNDALGVFEITGIQTPDGRVEVIPVDPAKPRTLLKKPKPLDEKTFAPSVQFRNEKWDVMNFNEKEYTIRRGSEVLTVPANTVRPFKLLSVPDDVRNAANGIGSFKPNEFNYGMLNDTYVSPDVYVLMESLTKENMLSRAASIFNNTYFGNAFWKRLAIAQNFKSLVAQSGQNFGLLQQNGVSALELPYYAVEFSKDRELVAEVEKLGLFTDMGSIEASGGASTGPRSNRFKSYNPRQLFVYEVGKQLQKTETPMPMDYMRAIYKAAGKQGYKGVTRAIPGLIQYQDALSRFALQRAFEQDNLATGMDLNEARKEAVKRAVEVSYRTNYNPALTVLSKTFVPFANVWAYNAFVQPYVAVTNPVGFLLGKMTQAIVGSLFGADKEDEEKEIVDEKGVTRKLTERERRELVDKFLRPRAFEFTTTSTPQTTRVGNTIVETGRFDPGRGTLLPEAGGTAVALVKAAAALGAAANQQPGAFREAMQALSMQRGNYAPPTTSETPATEDITGALASLTKAYFPTPYAAYRVAEPGRRQNFDRGLAAIQTLVTAYDYNKTSTIRTLMSKQQQEITANNKGRSRAYYDTNDPKKRVEIVKDYSNRELAIRKKYAAILRVIGSLSARNPEKKSEEAKALVGAGVK